MQKEMEETIAFRGSCRVLALSLVFEDSFESSTHRSNHPAVPAMHGFLPAWASLLLSTSLSTHCRPPQNYSQELLAFLAFLNSTYVIQVYVYAHSWTYRHACPFYPELFLPWVMDLSSSPALDTPNFDDAGLFSSVTTAVKLLKMRRNISHRP